MQTHPSDCDVPSVCSARSGLVGCICNHGAPMAPSSQPRTELTQWQTGRYRRRTHQKPAFDHRTPVKQSSLHVVAAICQQDKLLGRQQQPGRIQFALYGSGPSGCFSQWQRQTRRNITQAGFRWQGPARWRFTHAGVPLRQAGGSRAARAGRCQAAPQGL